MNFSDSFETCITVVLKNEGGYVNNPKDPGGETKYGICKKSYPNIDIKNLTISKAKEIYHKEFWEQIKGDSMPKAIALCVLDFAVNSGVSRSIMFLQKIAGTTADGKIGPQTLSKIENTKEFIDKFCDLRLAFLSNLKTFKTFGKGWTKRVNEVKYIAENMI